ncbi:hypothetical protein DFA_09319 [Cavenderia fasciculata]|uniref:Uncharacterized protein n=1 Tax=Cavenderia fasciculata TaxID=261658 RepID=F4Q7A7_CACFS|nr:uncharacterized protein DFA_09319 [Cavenderia fasciculata]EGG16289.1 hypothetical protein DFA_09319 [Cavenderia fasciculata]|eukprot:XP_004354673.1 hypothetical protein DFA_09319 [Cavenderia fasciculata]
MDMEWVNDGLHDSKDCLVWTMPHCSAVMLDYCLELITKDLPSGILSQEEMEKLTENTYKYVNSIELARSLTQPMIYIAKEDVEGYLNDLLSLGSKEFFQFDNIAHHFITVQLDIVYLLVNIGETQYPYLTIDDQELNKWNTYIAFKIILIDVISAMKLSNKIRIGFTNAISTLTMTGSTNSISNYYKKSIGACIDSDYHPESSTLFDLIGRYCTLDQVKMAYTIVQEYRNDKLLQWSLYKADRPLFITAIAASRAASSKN